MEQQVLERFSIWAKTFSSSYSPAFTVGQMTTCESMNNPAAFLDVDAPGAMGRITCWETGDYVAEVLNVKTDQTTYIHHGTLGVDTLDEQFLPFLRALERGV
jgi:hypothetical protein